MGGRRQVEEKGEVGQLSVESGIAFIFIFNLLWDPKLDQSSS